MKRKWNWSLWTGFLLVLIGFLSYIPFFALFPITRDFPWVNLLLFVAGLALLVSGVSRAFGQPQTYRGRIFGPILTVLSVLVIAFFAYGIFYEARRIPFAAGAPHVGQKAPDFTLPDQDGNLVSLSALLSSPVPHAGTTAKAVLLIFYRGYW
jgi:hypothetical protein